MFERDAPEKVTECTVETNSGMAPSPENQEPKAPDKTKHDKCPKEKNKDDKTLSDLNDCELKGLLDEALNYKNPKDREGKSKLFNNLLNEAEEDERNARAARAGGSNKVRHCNPSAKRNSRHRKQPSSSISENMMHGGSLDNLAKEELYETSKHRIKKSVSARQREGGSLPCNVNSSTLITHDYQFLEEARRKKKQMNEKTNDVVVEEQRLLEHDTLDQNFQEKVNELPQLKFTTRASLQVNVSENINNRMMEKTGSQTRAPIFHIFNSWGRFYNEVDGPIQFPHLEQNVERKSNTIVKNVAPIIGADCSGTFRISNDSKKVDENGNLHQNSIKTKKKKIVSDKNVVVCKAENVKGHRSDIITDIDKLMEFIGINEEVEKNRTIKSKLSRHSSDDNSKSARKQQQQRTNPPTNNKKENRSCNSNNNLKKSNSLNEISTTNDFEFKDKILIRNNKNTERRSWGNMEPIQNLLQSSSSYENLESEFHVVTKKKKSKKRRNSINGRTNNTHNKAIIQRREMDKTNILPDIRRKSACSVPHSEKSNDSSDDVDSVHSLPIENTKKKHTNRLTYADMAKTNERNNCCNNFTNNSFRKVPNEFETTTTTTTTNHIYDDLYLKENVKNILPPDVHNIKNFPAIAKEKKINLNSNNKIKQTMNLLQKNVVNYKNNICMMEHQNDNLFQSCNEAITTSVDMSYSSPLPLDIPDVQTIEKMQLINQGHLSNCYDTTILSATTTTLNNNPLLLNNGNDCSVDCDITTTLSTTSSSSKSVPTTTTTTTVISSSSSSASSDRTNSNNNYVVENVRPPVVILSGYGNSKEVPGLVFGFDINEQLLNEDNKDFICQDFITRYIQPENYTTTSHNHDKIVTYIGAAWEDALVNLSTGKVQYYSDML